MRVCGETPEVRAGAYNIRAPWVLADLLHADTVIVPGIHNPELPVPAPIISAIQAAAANGARIASICTGAFVLAAAGLLRGLRATTHWNAADLLAERYPDICVDRSVLYVDNGRILTSAGASSGLDLCLHLIRDAIMDRQSRPRSPGWRWRHSIARVARHNSFNMKCQGHPPISPLFSHGSMSIRMNHCRSRSLLNVRPRARGRLSGGSKTRLERRPCSGYCLPVSVMLRSCWRCLSSPSTRSL